MFKTVNNNNKKRLPVSLTTFKMPGWLGWMEQGHFVKDYNFKSKKKRRKEGRMLCTMHCYFALQEDTNIVILFKDEHWRKVSMWKMAAWMCSPRRVLSATHIWQRPAMAGSCLQGLPMLALLFLSPRYPLNFTATGSIPADYSILRWRKSFHTQDSWRELRSLFKRLFSPIASP